MSNKLRPDNVPTGAAAVPQDSTSHAEVGELQCSARRCRNTATWALRWHNPSLHEEGYVKVWLSCPEHLQWLSDFLDDRGFLGEVIPVAELDRS